PLFPNGDLTILVVADGAERDKRSSDGDPRSAVQPRHLVLPLSPATDFGRARYVDHAHVPVADRGDGDVLATERHHAATQTRLGQTARGQAPRRPAGILVRATRVTPLDRRHGKPAVFDDGSTRRRQLY